MFQLLVVLLLLFVAEFYIITTTAFQTISIPQFQHKYPIPTTSPRPQPSSPFLVTTNTVVVLWASTKKGFGKPTNNNAPPSSVSSSEVTPSTTTTTSTSSSSDSSSVKKNDNNSPLEVATKSSSSSSTMNAGQRALQELRRQKIEERDQELRLVREMMQADEQVQNSGPMAIPEPVAQRMGRRMLPFVGIPFFGGMITFVTFWYYATYQNLQFEPTLVAASTIVLLVVGLLGITYSVMSASWDPDREGSFIGWDEFQLNLQNVQDGLRRSRSNAILREKMSNLSTKEVQQALQDLDRREMKK